MTNAKIRRLFIYKTDIWHFFLGFSAGYIFSVSRWIAIAITLAYLLYQHFELEHVYESVKDMVMFFSGLLIALLAIL